MKSSEWGGFFILQLKEFWHKNDPCFFESVTDTFKCFDFTIGLLRPLKYLCFPTIGDVRDPTSHLTRLTKIMLFSRHQLICLWQNKYTQDCTAKVHNLESVQERLIENKKAIAGVLNFL
jgi:hypothetical protein